MPKSIMNKDASRCRYKTGRCMNARVVKPNGTQLLLCEYHRNQQNRTKKRSDMKYRQDRAKKRLVLRQQRKKVHDPAQPKSSQPNYKATGGISPASLDIREETLLTEDIRHFSFGVDATSALAVEYPFSTFTSRRLPHHVSPLCTPRQQVTHQNWHPEEVKLLEYFIM
jgi:hypothetical protein